MRVSSRGALASRGSRSRRVRSRPLRTSSVFWSANSASSSNALVSAERLLPALSLCGMFTGGLDMMFEPRGIGSVLAIWQVRRSRRGDCGARRGVSRAVSA